MKKNNVQIKIALVITLAFILLTCVENHVLPNFGTIFISSDPVGAKIFLDDEDTGKFTPDSLVELIGGDYKLSISKSEFIDTSFTVDLNDGQLLNFNLFLKETNPDGEITLTSEPSGAEIFINNVYTDSLTPAKFSNLGRGTYQVKLSLDLYDDSEFTVQLSKDQKVDKNTRMIIAGTAGSLFITSTPSGANIFLDDEFNGVTPDTIQPLAAGQYQLKLTLEDYRDTTIITNVQTSTMSTENITLTFYEPRGSISLDSSPKGANIFVNGINSELITPNIINKLEAGNYQIRLSLTQFFDTTFTVPVIEDQRTNWPLIEMEEIPFLITVDINPEGAGDVTGAGGYYQDDDVSLIATANTGYSFVNWTENSAVVSTNSTYTFNADSDRNLVANFSLNSHLITTSSNPPSGGSTSGGGTFNYGTTANLSAVPASGYTFINWTENGSPVHNEKDYSFTVTEDRNLVANFSINNYVITTSSNPPGGGTTSGDGGYDFGEEVTVSATPAIGFTFVNWTENGSQVSAEQNYTFIINGSRNLVANFLINTYLVSVTANPSNAGSIEGAGSYDHGDNVTLSATANFGYSFVNWTENSNELSDDAEFSFNIESDRSIVANFIENGNILVNSDPEGANIFLNNSFVGGQTPFTIENLLAGEYNITLRLEDFADTTVSATVVSGATTNLGSIYLRDVTPEVGVTISYSVNPSTQRLEFSFLFNQSIFLSRIGITTANGDFFLIPFNATYLEGIPVNWGFPEKLEGTWRFNFIGNKVGGRQDNFNFEEIKLVE